MKLDISSAFRRYLDDEGGVTAVIAALSIVFLLGTAAMATDMGYLYASKLKLQSSADASALAGAEYIATTSTSNPTTVAESYNSVSGSNNASKLFLVKASGVTVTLKCLTTLTNENDPCVTGFPGAPAAGANAIQVVEKATAPAFFGQVLGIDTYAVSATATAAARGGQPAPLDVIIVLDTTASMGSSGSDPNCGLGSSGSKINCALLGLRTLLLSLSPSVQNVGLIVFPGMTTQAQANVDFNCSGKTPAITPYNDSPFYNIVFLGTSQANNYRSSNSSKTLNTSSDLVDAAGGGGTGCPGVTAPGGDGTYYAAAITQAQAALAADGQPKAHQAIILESDGEANATSQVQTVTVTGGGSGYSATPTVTFTAPTGGAEEGQTVGAPTVTVTMSGSGSNQSVASITIKNAGAGYTAVPKVTISAPTGSSKTKVTATATATLTTPGLQQCNAAVTAAKAATTAGTQVFTIAYGSSTSASDCSTDTAPTITPCAALLAMASTPANFYSDDTGGTACPGATSVTTISQAFQSIASSITNVRLIPDKTT